MSSNWPMVPLREVLQLQRRWIKLHPTETYREIGIRSFGKGVFHKAPIHGSTLGNKRVLRIEPGDLVFNNVFAWEGAVAVATPEEAGMIGSHRFITYTVLPEKGDAQFLKLFFTTKDGLDVLSRASPGSAGRNKTLGLDRFIDQSIPLPSPTDQRRLVERVETLEAKIEEAKRLRREATQLRRAFISSLHVTIAAGRTQRLEDIVDICEDRVPVVPGAEYPQIGVKGFGGGLFNRETLNASQTTYRAFNRLYSGAVVLSQVKGWEGAIAVCPEDMAGRFVSPEYRTFRCKPSLVIPEYMAAIVPTPWFWQQLAGLTRGVGARRERIRPEVFLQMEIPFPLVDQQQEALTVLHRLGQVEKEAATIPNELDAMLPAIVDRAFKGEL